MSDKRIYVERRPEGDYAVRKPGSERASDVTRTQAGAIERAREISPGASVHVERVRYTSGGKPDKWRRP
jgi:hypothetical protein